MNNNELKELSNYIKELAKNKIDSDTKQGNDLSKKCLKYDSKKECNSVHQYEVISFISRINKSA